LCLQLIQLPNEEDDSYCETCHTLSTEMDEKRTVWDPVLLSWTQGLRGGISRHRESAWLATRTPAGQYVPRGAAPTRPLMRGPFRAGSSVTRPRPPPAPPRPALTRLVTSGAHRRLLIPADRTTPAHDEPFHRQFYGDGFVVPSDVNENTPRQPPHLRWRTEPVGSSAGRNFQLHTVLAQSTSVEQTVMELVASYLEPEQRLGLYDFWLDPARSALAQYQAQGHAFCPHSSVRQRLETHLSKCPNRSQASHLWADQTALKRDRLPLDVDRYWWFFLSPQAHMLRFMLEHDCVPLLWRQRGAESCPTEAEMQRWCTIMGMSNGPEPIQPQHWQKMPDEECQTFRGFCDGVHDLDRVHQTPHWTRLAPFFHVPGQAPCAPLTPKGLQTVQQAKDKAVHEDRHAIKVQDAFRAAHANRAIGVPQPGKKRRRRADLEFRLDWPRERQRCGDVLLPWEVVIQHPLLSLSGPVRTIQRACVPSRRKRMDPTTSGKRIAVAIQAADWICSRFEPKAFDMPLSALLMCHTHPNRTHPRPAGPSMDPPPPKKRKVVATEDLDLDLNLDLDLDLDLDLVEPPQGM